MTSERNYEGKGNHATSTQTNGSNPEQTAIFAVVNPKSIAGQLLNDALADPAIATAIRTNLRTWFLSGLDDKVIDDGWAHELGKQIHHYEVLDELLAICTKKAIGTTHPLAPADIDVNQFVCDHFCEAHVILNIGRSLRQWFINSLDTHEDNIGTVLGIQKQHYETLDELLLSLVEHQLGSAE